MTCGFCGLSHSREARLARLRRLLPCTSLEAQEAYPCTWASDKATLWRDLHLLGARRAGGDPKFAIWTLEPE